MALVLRVEKTIRELRTFNENYSRSIQLLHVNEPSRSWGRWGRFRGSAYGLLHLHASPLRIICINCKANNYVVDMHKLCPPGGAK